MNELIYNGLLVAAICGIIGAIIGIILAVASKAFYVEEDPRYDKILEALPGFNCGACGYPGCSGMTDGLLKGEADVKACTPGNELTYAKVRAILKGEDVEQVSATK